jgi:DNA-binding NtrC family response regulator
MTEPHSLHILLVDDEDSFRLSIEMGLKMTSDFAIESCGSGEEAVDILKKETFDVILLDNRMGEMSGMDVLEWMHSQKISTPVILVTAAGSESTAIEAMQLGVYDYVRKDHLDIERLTIAVKSVYERYQYRKQIIENEAKERLLQEKQDELDSLRTFHDTVNSVGQLVEKSLADLASNLKRQENELLTTVKEGKEGQCKEIFAELKQGIEVVSSGVSSMRSLAAMVTRKLDDIHIAPPHTKH